jgi:hypothetical protein
MPASAARSADVDMASSSKPVYVYGVVRADTLRDISVEGVGDAPVELVEHGDLAAVVGVLKTKNFRVKRRDLQRHLRVIEEAFGVTTILPCPFGTVIQSAKDLEETLLARRHDELLSAIGRLEHNVQMNVRAVYDEEMLLRSIVESDPEIAALRESTQRLGEAGYFERLRLGELVAAAISEQRERDGGRLVNALAPGVVDVVVEPADDAAALKASFLVDRDRLAAFDGKLDEVAGAEQPLLRFEVIGPLPPTAFASAYTDA